MDSDIDKQFGIPDDFDYLDWLYYYQCYLRVIVQLVWYW